MEAMEKEDQEKLRKQLLLQKKKLKIKIKRPEIIFSPVFFMITKLNYFPKNPPRISPNPPPPCCFC